MNTITVILSCLFFCLYTLDLTAPLEKGRVGFRLIWLSTGLYLLGFELSMNRVLPGLFLFIVLEGACYQDLKTQYFSKWWFVCSLILCFPPFVCFPWKAEQFSGVLIALVLLPFWFKKKIGSADLLAIAIFGILLGTQRLVDMLICSCLSGLVLFRWFKTETLPFVSFLCFWTVVFWSIGYSICDFCLRILY